MAQYHLDDVESIDRVREYIAGLRSRLTAT
jgi:hypothetical protein